MLKRVVRFVQNSRTVIGYLILMGSVIFAITISYGAIRELRQKDNATRCRIVALVETFTENSQRSAKATLASPSASKEQKDAATANLKGVQAALRTTQDKLGNPTGAACTIASS